MFNSVRPHRQQPTRLCRPWDSPGKNTGVGCHFLLQSIKVKSESEVAQLCLTLCDPMDSSPPGSSAHGIFQARVLEWGAIAFSDNIYDPFQKKFAFSCPRERVVSSLSSVEISPFFAYFLLFLFKLLQVSLFPGSPWSLFSLTVLPFSLPMSLSCLTGRSLLAIFDLDSNMDFLIKNIAPV